MQKSPLLPYTYITSFLSVVRAFSVTVGTPTQCDDLPVSWTGKHISTTCNILQLNVTTIVRWTSTISDHSDSCSSVPLSQVYEWRAYSVPRSLLRVNACAIYLYQHQHLAMAKAHIQYHNSHLKTEHNFYSLCLTPPGLVQVGRQPS
jgi:hypothetical protein